VLSFPLFAFTFCLADPLTVLLFGPRYAEAGAVLAWLSIGCYVRAALGLNARTLKVLGHLRTVLAVDLTSACLALILNLWLVPARGAVGGGVAVTMTIIAHTLLTQVALKRASNIPLLSGSIGRVFLLLAGSVVLLVTARRLGAHWAVLLALAIAAWIPVLHTARRHMGLHEVFPGLRHLPAIGSWFDRPKP
jgi:O-antigen/teichoic acid export membrane protein